MPLLDAYGRPVVYEALREEQAAPTLAGIRNIYSIVDTSIALTPEKVVGILRTAEFGDPWYYLELAERMEEKDLLYQGLLHTRKMAVSQLDIDVKPANDTPEAHEDATFIRNVLIDSMQFDLHDVVFEILDSLGKGFSATEILWDTEGRNPITGGPAWLPFQLKWRDPRWFMFDWVSGEQLLVRSLRTDGPQLPIGRDTWDARLSPVNLRMRVDGGHEIGIQPATEPLAPFKFITHVTRAKAGLPIRGGLARIAMWVYLFKSYILRDWIVFAEVYGQPMRLGKYGPGATENDKAALLRAVANIGTDASAIIPESMAIEFVESRGGGQKSHEMYEKFCAYLDKLLTIGILGQELTTSLPPGSGSRAAAQVHDVVRRDIATDDARRVSSTLNRDLVKPIIDLNRGPRQVYPQITIQFNEEQDLVHLMEGLSPAIDRGLPVPQGWLFEQFGIPEPHGGEPVMHPATKGDPQKGGPDGGPPPPHRPAPMLPASAIAGPSLEPAYTDVGKRRQQMAVAGRKKGFDASRMEQLLSDRLASIGNDVTAAALKAYRVEAFAAEYDPELHPKDAQGRWTESDGESKGEEKKPPAPVVDDYTDEEWEKESVNWFTNLGGYRYMNDPLFQYKGDMEAIKRDPKVTAGTIRTMARMDSALKKSPKVKGDVWRGVRAKLVPKDLVVGSEMVVHGYLSTSSNRAISNKFATKRGKDSAIYHIHSKSGRDISQYGGEHPEEKEVVFERGSKFRVVGISADKKGRNVYEMEEA